MNETLCDHCAQPSHGEALCERGRYSVTNWTGREVAGSSIDAKGFLTVWVSTEYGNAHHTGNRISRIVKMVDGDENTCASRAIDALVSALKDNGYDLCPSTSLGQRTAMLFACLSPLE